MTINLEADLEEQAAAFDPCKWTLLECEVVMVIANAQFFAFQAEAERMAYFVSRGLLTRAAAADILHTSALYSALYYTYGRDRIHAVMAQAFEVAA